MKLTNSYAVIIARISEITSPRKIVEKVPLFLSDCSTPAPARLGGTPRTCSLSIIQITCVAKIAIETVEVNAKRLRCLAVVRLVDLHNANVIPVYKPSYDLSRLRVSMVVF